MRAKAALTQEGPLATVLVAIPEKSLSFGPDFIIPDATDRVLKKRFGFEGR